jgi:acyl-coenzyme A thioesterase PaaI-like protein
MSLSELILHQPSADTLRLWLTKVPYAVYLGVEAEVEGDDILFILPQDPKLIGNPTLPAIHGGVVGGFMELAAAFHLIAKMDNPVMPKVINFSLDYLRAARLRDTYARCTLTRQGRQIANVSITAWQEDIEQPSAIARAHFLVPEPD